jgi:hypothetical protein
LNVVLEAPSLSAPRLVREGIEPVGEAKRVRDMLEGGKDV